MSQVESPWVSIFEGERGQNLARMAREEGVRRGLIDPTWTFLASPLSFSNRELDDLVDGLRSIENLIYHLPERLYDGNYEAFLRTLKIPEPMVDFLSQTYDPKARTPIRWDLIGTQSGWKILELNLGCCLGGLTGYSLHAVYEEFAKSAGKSISQTIPDGLSILSRHLQGQLQSIRHNRIAILEEDSAAEAYGFYQNALAKALEQTTGFSVVATTLSQMDDYEFDAVVPMFTVNELFSQFDRYEKQIKAFLDGSLVNLVNFNEYVFSHKGVLALLRNPENWSRFSEQERKAIVRFVPNTRFVDDQLDGLPSEVVLKPCSEYGGEGVVCSWTVDAATFSAALASAHAQSTAFILQERATAQDCPIVTVTADGVVHHGLGRPVMGLITIEGEVAGGLARALMDNKNPGVVNAHQGAAMGLVTMQKETL